MKRDWDIFCAVVDNFGDIGVCWRLARQIVQERGESVRLWVDDLVAFALLQPAIMPDAAIQLLDGVTVCRWCEPMPDVVPAAIVLEAFACNPPASFLAAMATQAKKPVWINLEYLSAEDWVEGCHALGSRHPRLPLNHFFFFPGFTAQTGGLLREQALLPLRRTWQQGEMSRHTFLRDLGVDATGLQQMCVSLFCYDNPALPALLTAWQNGPGLTLLVAAGKPQRQVEAWLQQPFPAGSRVQRGRLQLVALPFLSQDNYDRLLWSCDLNFIRGEDSFVRAQWAAKPLCWHIYPQEEAAHLVKLDAFLARYVAELPLAAAAALGRFWQVWNAGDATQVAAAWAGLLDDRPALAAHAMDWCDRLAMQADLLTQLVDFAEQKQPSGS